MLLKELSLSCSGDELILLVIEALFCYCYAYGNSTTGVVERGQVFVGEVPKNIFPMKSEPIIILLTQGEQDLYSVKGM